MKTIITADCKREYFIVDVAKHSYSELKELIRDLGVLSSSEVVLYSDDIDYIEIVTYKYNDYAVQATTKDGVKIYIKL